MSKTLTTSKRTVIGLRVGHLDLARDAEIGRGVGRDVVGVGEAGAQPAAVDRAHAEPRVVPEVRRAGRAGDPLRVVGVDVVAGDVGELVGAEQILVRHDGLGDLASHGDVAVGVEVAVLVGRAHFDALVLGLVVVEAAEDQRRAELPVVEQILGALVVGVDRDLKVGA